jgi:hypothetical protein
MKKDEAKTVSVKISIDIVEKVRRNKKYTGVPVGKFFEISAENELKKYKANLCG